MTCPVLLLTPEVEELITWWEATHAKVSTGVGQYEWQMVRLPGPGSVGEQDARLMNELEIVTQVRNAMLAKSLQPKQTYQGEQVQEL